MWVMADSISGALSRCRKGGRLVREWPLVAPVELCITRIGALLLFWVDVLPLLSVLVVDALSVAARLLLLLVEAVVVVLVGAVSFKGI